MNKELTIIGYLYNRFPEKFGLPHQSGRIPQLKGEIIFEKEFHNREAFKGLEEFSHIWIIWDFSEAKKENWSPTVRPPRLGGNIRKGVFATRSPFRPNSIGMTVAKLEKIEFDQKIGPILHVSGIDLMNGTPIYDIKPYLPYVDSVPEATGGFTDSISESKIELIFSDELLHKIPEECREELVAVLKNDPRPGYQREKKEKIYGMTYDKYNVVFRGKNNIIEVLEIKVE